jgi:hypothetical protein
MPGGTLPKSPEGMARETLRPSKPMVVSQYVDGLRWKHASPRDESLIPAVTRFGGRPIAVCFEQSRGGIAYALLKYDFLVLFPLPPARLASYRESFSNSGAKDDPTDAALLVDYLLRHRDQLRVWQPDTPRRASCNYYLKPAVTPSISGPVCPTSLQTC